MPIMNRVSLVAALLGAMAAGACEKNGVQDITAPAEGAFIRFANMSVGAPGVYFYANETKMAGRLTATGAEPTTGFAYGSYSVDNGNYSTIAPGSYTLSGRIAATADNGLPVARTTTTLENGRFYTFYMGGLFDAAGKQGDSFVVEDPLPTPIDYTTASIRLVNAIGNSAPLTLYATNTATTTETPVGGAVAYRTAGAFVKLPPGQYNLATRVGGAATNAIVRTGISLVGGRVYTITARGDMTVTSTTAVNRPFLDNTANR